MARNLGTLSEWRHKTRNKSRLWLLVALSKVFEIAEHCLKAEILSDNFYFVWKPFVQLGGTYDVFCVIPVKNCSITRQFCKIVVKIR